jgi:hypothetical protein
MLSSEMYTVKPTLKMEAAHSSETLINICQTMEQCHIPEDNILHD